MVTNNARPTAFMTLRRSLPNNLAAKIVNKSSANHRYNEKLKNTRRRTHVGHLPNNLTLMINNSAGLPPGGGLAAQLRLARAHRNYKGFHLAAAERNNQRRQALNNRQRAVRNGRLTPEQSLALLMQSLQVEPRYTRFW